MWPSLWSLLREEAADSKFGGLGLPNAERIGSPLLREEAADSKIREPRPSQRGEHRCGRAPRPTPFFLNLNSEPSPLGGDAGVVEKDHFAVLEQIRAGHSRGIPVIHDSDRSALTRAGGCRVLRRSGSWRSEGARSVALCFRHLPIVQH